MPGRWALRAEGEPNRSRATGQPGDAGDHPGLARQDTHRGILRCKPVEVIGERAAGSGTGGLLEASHGVPDFVLAAGLAAAEPVLDGPADPAGMAGVAGGAVPATMLDAGHLNHGRGLRRDQQVAGQRPGLPATFE